MVFSSLIFLFSFLPFVLIGNFVWRNRFWQNLLLFVASLYFYAWGEREKVFVMLASILVNFFIGLQIEKRELSSGRKLFLTIGVIVNLGVLIYFKYTEFFVENLNLFLRSIGLNTIEGLKYERLPIGISFYTFQSISYLVDVYRRTVNAQRNFLNLGLYIAFFPQLIAGPIVRYKEIEDQLRNRIPTFRKFEKGCQKFIVGLGKKMLLANPIAYVVDEIYYLPAEQLTSGLSWLAALGYSLQIYLDFSGYTDMAIGLGLMFGFVLPRNFNFPYISKNIREFWTRWHITLSVWFRDYLYIPLGGNRGSQWFTLRNLLIVFFITGLWHGASWSFIVWGLFHGLFMVLERLGLAAILKRLPSLIQHLYTLLVVIIGWVFFRIEELGEALKVLKLMFWPVEEQSGFSVFDYAGSYFWTVFFVGILVSFPIHRLWNSLQPASYYFTRRYLGKPIGLLIFFLSVLEMVNSTYNPFIYFRF